MPRPPRPILAACSAARAAHAGSAEALLVLLPLWAQAFGLSLTQAGALKSAFHAAMAAGRIPSGTMSGRLGERRLLALGTLGAAVGWLLLAEAGGFGALLVALLAAGLGSGVQHPLASRLLGRTHRGERVRAALAVFNVAGDAGKAIVPALLALGIGYAGWRTASAACGVAMAIVALGVHLSLQRFVSGAIPAAPRNGGRAGREVIDRRGLVVLGVIAVIDVSSRSGFLLLAPFLMVGKGLPVEHVGFAIMLIFIGGAAGKLACGFIAERLGTIRTIAIAESATALGIVTAIAVPMGWLWVLLAPIGIVLCATPTMLYAAAGELAPEGRRTRAFGLLHGVTATASLAAPIAFGVLGDALGPMIGAGVVAALAGAAAPIALALRSKAPVGLEQRREAGEGESGPPF